MQPKRGKLSAPHFCPPAPYTIIPSQSPDYYSSPNNRRRTCGHGAMNDQRKQGPLGEHKRAIGRVNRRQVPKQQELALRHYSSPNHRSTERCPIWDSKNPSRCQSLGTFGAVYECLDPSLRSPRNPNLHRAVVGVAVPASFSPAASDATLRVSHVFDIQPSLPTPTTTSMTLSSHPEAR
ncbi:hypothetical protein CRG98_004823 [Punica granatum]|uniref:Uncharacterized protein n=1 Tax=Punica granatum TaxID=22663 RepID=A0A2I0L286_PUNGR|nr:hypothetical protein CRG98_004823 [Punica granatum]